MNNDIVLIMDELFNKFGIAVDWTSENVLPYLMELMGRLRMYQIVSYSLLIILCLLIIIPIVKLFKNYSNCLKTEKDNIFFEHWSGGISCTSLGFTFLTITLILTPFSIAGLIILPQKILQWIFIPEFAMIEYMTNMVSG